MVRGFTCFDRASSPHVQQIVLCASLLSSMVRSHCLRGSTSSCSPSNLIDDVLIALIFSPCLHCPSFFHPFRLFWLLSSMRSARWLSVGGLLVRAMFPWPFFLCRLRSYERGDPPSIDRDGFHEIGESLREKLGHRQLCSCS